MRIEKLLPYGKTRTKVLFEEGLVLVFYNGELHRLHLEEGAEISEEIYRTKLLPLLTARAGERLVNILKSADKPEAELRRRLRESFYPPEAVDAAIDRAKEKHYVDDARYVETYLRCHGEDRSAKKILYDLQAKGIRRELILRMLEESDIDEGEQIRAELRKRKFSADMDPKDKQRIYAALARKGYSWEQIRSAVNEGTEELC